MTFPTFDRDFFPTGPESLKSCDVIQDLGGGNSNIFYVHPETSVRFPI